MPKTSGSITCRKLYYIHDFVLNMQVRSLTYLQYQYNFLFKNGAFFLRTVLEKMSCPFPVLTLRGYNEVENYIDRAGKSET